MMLSIVKQKNEFINSYEFTFHTSTNIPFEHTTVQSKSQWKYQVTYEKHSMKSKLLPTHTIRRHERRTKINQTLKHK